MGSIQLHPQFGLNPTLGVCFWCGEEDGTIGLLGRNKGKEAPRRSVLSYEPCQKCKDGMALGITCIEADVYPNFEGQPPFQEKPQTVYPTGNLVVIKEEAAERIFGETPFWPTVKAGRKLIADKELFKQLTEGPDDAKD